jgi:SAM-dependent methyltransferase
MIRQLIVPRGMLGRVTGHNMARINAEMNRAMIALLALRGDELALEVGFGPGVGVRLLLDALPRGLVCGVDPSAVMRRQAARRNRAGIRAGRADLRAGTVIGLPWPDAYFDVVCSANTVQVWESLDGGGRELRRVLRRGGRLVLSVHAYAGEDLAGTVPPALRAAGFADVTVRHADDRSGATLHFLASATGSAG